MWRIASAVISSGAGRPGIAAVETIFRLMQFVYAPFYALFIVGPIANLIEIEMNRRAAAAGPARAEGARS